MNSLWLGWAYNLKTVPEDVIRKRAARTGDGTNKYSKIIGTDNEKMCTKMDKNNNVAIDEDHHDGFEGENLIWGWDDVDMNAEDKSAALIIN